VSSLNLRFWSRWLLEDVLSRCYHCFLAYAKAGRFSGSIIS